MMFLIGIMGLMAVGATALFGFDTPVSESERSTDAEPDIRDTGYEVEQMTASVPLIAANVNGFPSNDGVHDSMDREENRPFSGSDTLIFSNQVEPAPSEHTTPPNTFLEQLQRAHASNISGFEAGEDSLVITYDDAAGAEPDIALQRDERTPSTQHVLVNGARVASVEQAGTLSLEDTVLISQSTLKSLSNPSEQAA